MRTLETWLSDYSADHLNRQNQRLHLICVPLIFTSVVGALHLLPWHIGHALLAAALVWYAFLGARALGIMFAQMAAAAAVTDVLQKETSTTTTAVVLALIFVIAWLGQFYGHKLEGRRPSFFKDLQYLLIGPLWVWLGH